MSDLGPQPDPTAEEPQLEPGGVDAVEPDADDNGLARDLDPADNPAVEDALPGEIAQPDDKQQEPDDNGVDEEAGTESDEKSAEESEKESQEDGSDQPGSTGDTPEAGQEDEEGGVEPPA